ncbi:MAG: hypothetical protein KC621_06090 [Myxococcales bacterium]|nr:hypothetical protein [Myxococcales bacterium]
MMRSTAALAVAGTSVGLGIWLAGGQWVIPEPALLWVVLGVALGMGIAASGPAGIAHAASTLRRGGGEDDLKRASGTLLAMSAGASIGGAVAVVVGMSTNFRYLSTPAQLQTRVAVELVSGFIGLALAGVLAVAALTLAVRSGAGPSSQPASGWPLIGTGIAWAAIATGNHLLGGYHSLLLDLQPALIVLGPTVAGALLVAGRETERRAATWVAASLGGLVGTAAAITTGAVLVTLHLYEPGRLGTAIVTGYVGSIYGPMVVVPAAVAAQAAARKTHPDAAHALGWVAALLGAGMGAACITWTTTGLVSVLYMLGQIS